MNDLICFDMFTTTVIGFQMRNCGKLAQTNKISNINTGLFPKKRNISCLNLIGGQHILTINIHLQDDYIAKNKLCYKYIMYIISRSP